MKLVVLLVAATLIGCGSKKPAPTAEKAEVTESATEGESVTLTFAWPAGLDGKVEVEGLSEKQEQTQQVFATYGLTSSEVEGGVALTYEPQKVETPGLDERARAMAEPLLRASPIVVFNDGGVVALGNFEDTKARLEEMLAPAYEDMPALEAQMKPMLTEEVFLAATQDEWEWRGTAFHGLTMSVGESVQSESEFEMMFAKGKVKAQIVSTLEEVLPCPGVEDRQCVRLRRELTVDPEAVRAAIDNKALAANMTVERSVVVELIAEPSTLLTHRMSKVEKIKATIGTGENAKSMSERKESTETYTWK